MNQDYIEGTSLKSLEDYLINLKYDKELIDYAIGNIGDWDFHAEGFDNFIERIERDLFEGCEAG